MVNVALEFLPAFLAVCRLDPDALEETLSRRTGDHMRWQNVLEQYGVDATDEQKIDAAMEVLASMNRGGAGNRMA